MNHHAANLAVLLLTVSATTLPAQDEPAIAADIQRRLAAAGHVHPRLFLRDEDLPELRQKLAGSARLGALRDDVIATADHVLDSDLLRREQVGRRLLGVSRSCLKRVTHLAMAFRLTGRQAYAERAAAEMLAVAAFTDWNPSHFLDVAEMTAALAIGYDWLLAALSADDRERIRTAIVEKGLRPGLAGGWWVDTTNNWNQVCHGGLSLGALAVAEHEPEIAARIVTRAVARLPRAMHEYAPDGAYPEGPAYWVYGTSFNVLVLDAYASVLGTDFGLGDAPGFYQSPRYYLHVTGPTGLFFNYSDCRSRGRIATPMYWFARQLGDPGLLHHEVDLLDAFVEDAAPSADGTQRLLPLALVWSPPLGDVSAPAERHWHGGGATPVALFRNGWDDDATFVGIKAGSPGVNHAHMDAGTFVIDALGTRWAEDLGSQSYHSLESRGVDLWNRRQDSERWTVFRLSTAAHNVPMVDGRAQRVDGVAELVKVVTDDSRPRAVVDLGPVYAEQLAAARRGVELLPDGSVRIQDELTASAGGDRTVRWAMLTRAEVEIADPARAVLRRDGRRVELVVEAPEAAELAIIDTSAPRADFDQPNPGTRMVVFETVLEAGESASLTVLLRVGDGAAPPPRPLRDW